MMRSNVVLQPSDTRRLSPQTTSSSGYHSDLSSSNESPQSIHDAAAAAVVAGEPASYSSYDRRTTTDRKSSANKNLARLSTFFRQQYERAKSKLLPSRASIPSVSTCSKATSITPVVSPYANSNYATSPAPYASSAAYTYSSFVEPVGVSRRLSQSRCIDLSSKVYSVYVHPLYEVPSQTYASINDCQSHRLSAYAKIPDRPVNAHSYRRLAAMSNYGNRTTTITGYPSMNNNPRRPALLPPPLPPTRHRRCPSYQSARPAICQSYYPYRYINKNYDTTRASYAPLSDFLSGKTSAFKPVQQKFRHRHPQHSRPLRAHLPEPIGSSDDPCDLEVAQYFHHTSHWSNPNYFDVYAKDGQAPVPLPRHNYSETLC